MDKILVIILYITIFIIMKFIYKVYFDSFFMKAISIFTILFMTAFVYQQFFITQEKFDSIINSDTFFSKIIFIVIFLLFFLTSFGIILIGIKSIKEKESIPLAIPGIKREMVVGKQAIIHGFLYLIIGSVFFYGIMRVLLIILLN